MSILINCYVYPPEVQSAGTLVQELAEDLAKGGHVVTFITGFPSFPRGELYGGWRRRWKDEKMAGGFRLVRV